MDADSFLRQLEYVAGELDAYEQCVYLYLIRESRLKGEREVVVAFESACRYVGRSNHKAEASISADACHRKLLSLSRKGFIRVLDSEYKGKRIRVFLPHEIEGLIPSDPPTEIPNIECLDFFTVPENRRAIFEREEHRCFYCKRRLTEENSLIEHVVSRPEGDNGYRNVVAACRDCNNRKRDSSADDFLRTLYRDGFLSQSDFDDRRSHLDRLRAGELKPEIADLIE